ncbi:MAG TPA: DinB family protein, partial [Puia sp.]|nr:DinB family protein [Puia sp.]
KQYALVRTSRNILFDFVRNEVGEEELNRRFPAYADKSISDLLVHSASCYFHWLAYLALQQPRGSLYEGGTTMEELHRLYEQVDTTMALFLEHFAASMDESFDGVHDDGWRVRVTPLELFTHVTTHEYHHKGQIVLICRMLGHVPVDTDASNAFEEGKK